MEILIEKSRFKKVCKKNLRLNLSKIEFYTKNCMASCRKRTKMRNTRYLLNGSIGR